eukprot:29539-Rhodomonas_salina.1
MAIHATRSSIAMLAAAMRTIVAVQVLNWVYGATSKPLYNFRISQSPGISLRACYAMSGTAIAEAGICLRTSCAAHTAICLRPRYALSGTDTPLGGTRNR